MGPLGGSGGGVHVVGSSYRRVTAVVSQHESISRSSAVDAAGLNIAVNPALEYWQSTQQTVSKVG